MAAMVKVMLMLTERGLLVETRIIGRVKRMWEMEMGSSQ